MKTPSIILVAVLVLAAAAGIYWYKKTRGQPHRPGAIRVGDRLSHEFSRPMFHDRGVGSLEDLRGVPVLILIWGKN